MLKERSRGVFCGRRNWEVISAAASEEKWIPPGVTLSPRCLSGDIRIPRGLGKRPAALQDKLKERGCNYTPVTGEQKEAARAHRVALLLQHFYFNTYTPFPLFTAFQYRYHSYLHCGYFHFLSFQLHTWLFYVLYNYLYMHIIPFSYNLYRYSQIYTTPFHSDIRRPFLIETPICSRPWEELQKQLHNATLGWVLE